jgi:hypothetical protein
MATDFSVGHTLTWAARRQHEARAEMRSLWRNVGPPIVWFIVGTAALTATIMNLVSTLRLAPAEAALVIAGSGMGMPVVDLSRSAQCQAQPAGGSTLVRIDHSGVLASLNGGQDGRQFSSAPGR